MRKIFVAIFLYSIIAALTQICLSIVLAESGNSKISKEGGILKCDWIECPKETKRCVVTKNTRKNDLTHIDRKVTCYDGNNKKLMTEKKTENNPNPNESVSSHLEGSANSSSSSFDGTVNNTNLDLVSSVFSGSVNKQNSKASVSSYLGGSTNSANNFYLGHMNSGWDWSGWNPFYYWW